LEKWILSFNIYENWAVEKECPKLSISGRENVRGMSGENVLHPIF